MTSITDTITRTSSVVYTITLLNHDHAHYLNSRTNAWPLLLIRSRRRTSSVTYTITSRNHNHANYLNWLHDLISNSQTNAWSLLLLRSRYKTTITLITIYNESYQLPTLTVLLVIFCVLLKKKHNASFVCYKTLLK
jgi:hypothetical protein